MVACTWLVNEEGRENVVVLKNTGLFAAGSQASSSSLLMLRSMTQGGKFSLVLLRDLALSNRLKPF